MKLRGYQIVTIVILAAVATVLLRGSNIVEAEIESLIRFQGIRSLLSVGALSGSSTANAWVDSETFGLENERVLLHGAKKAYLYD